MLVRQLELLQKYTITSNFCLPELDARILPFLDRKSKNTVTDVISDVKSLPLDSRWLLLAPIHLEEGRQLEDKLKVLLQQGFARILVDNEMVRLDEFSASDLHQFDNKDILLIIDRIVVKEEEEFYNRLADAVQTAFLKEKESAFSKN